MISAALIVACALATYPPDKPSQLVEQAKRRWQTTVLWLGDGSVKEEIIPGVRVDYLTYHHADATYWRPMLEYMADHPMRKCPRIIVITVNLRSLTNEWQRNDTHVSIQDDFGEAFKRNMADDVLEDLSYCVRAVRRTNADLLVYSTPQDNETYKAKDGLEYDMWKLNALQTVRCICAKHGKYFMNLTDILRHKEFDPACASVAGMTEPARVRVADLILRKLKFKE